MKFVSRTLLLLLSATAISFTAGCSDVKGPTQPEMAVPEIAAAKMADRAMLEPIAKFRVKPQITIAWAKKWIGPEGGRLDFQGFAVDVPAGAVDRVTQFSIRLPVDPQGSEHVVAEFGPHGSTFNVPVTIEFPLRGTSIENSPSPAVLWWNNSVWEDMGGQPTADGARVWTTTTHFSTYGTTEAARGGVMTSGG